MISLKQLYLEVVEGKYSWRDYRTTGDERRYQQRPLWAQFDKKSPEGKKLKKLLTQAVLDPNFKDVDGKWADGIVEIILASFISDIFKRKGGGWNPDSSADLKDIDSSYIENFLKDLPIAFEEWMDVDVKKSLSNDIGRTPMTGAYHDAWDSLVKDAKRRYKVAKEKLKQKEQEIEQEYDEAEKVAVDRMEAVQRALSAAIERRMRKGVSREEVEALLKSRKSSVAKGLAGVRQRKSGLYY
jgi:hypothetical protein